MKENEKELSVEEVNVYSVNCGQPHGCMVDCPDITFRISAFL